VICLYEVFKKVNIVADEAKALQAIAQMKQGRVISITEEIALKAALNSIKYKLPMADSMIYATGQVEGAVVWTQDEHFENLPGVKYKKAFTKD
ncbi:MAG: type II toxin-antitoxin system VapC family toxin, partial [bacterium]